MPDITWLSAHPPRDRSAGRLPGSSVVRKAVPALYGAIKKWRERRRTLRALAHLDDRLLRDIGVMRGDDAPWWSTADRPSGLALGDSEIIHLSDFARGRWRKVRQGETHARHGAMRRGTR